ncbi:MAG: helix-turn-helix domain-containing protein [Kofleriaceae bacterium]
MRLLSPRDLADALGVSESSLKRWIDAGKIEATRTEGGHRRILLAEAVRFIRESGAPLARPELLGLPEVTHARLRPDGGRLIGYLVDGDAVGARGWLMARYLAGATIAELCDEPVRDAMHELGELWSHDEAGIFVEHRGTDCCLQALAQLRAMTTETPGAPIALGGAPEDDPYLLPSLMAAAVLSSAGMRTTNVGPDTPVSAFRHAVNTLRPRLVWISVTVALAPARARSIATWLATLPSSIVVVVGGQLAKSLPTPANVLRANSMGELSSIGSTIVTRAAS